MLKSSTGIQNSIHNIELPSVFLQERVFLSVSNYIFTVIFVAEMTVKVKMIRYAIKIYIINSMMAVILVKELNGLHKRFLC